MSHKMRIRKGDTVHMLSGKDRGKEGRVIDARPKDGKVIVENLNIVKRHTKPRPIQNTSRMGSAVRTRPCLPRSLPLRIWTVSPRLIFILVPAI